jgi:hypothetical protein
MTQRKRDRAIELQEMRNKTRHVIRKFEDPGTRSRQVTPFRNRVISLNIQEIGIAFPLSTRQDTIQSKWDTTAVPAFLFSIASMKFATQREESGMARIANCAFQFVPR